jgi:chromosome segregation ATPase
LLEAKRVELAELTQKAARLRSERSDREAELQSLQLAVSRAENRIASLSDELAGTTTRRDATASRISELGQEIASATRARDEAQAAVDHAKAAADTEQQTVEAMFQALRAAEEQLHAHQQSLSDAEKEAYRFERAIAEKESRLEILRQLNEEGEGLAKGSKAVLKGLADPDRIRPALAGALVASLDVDREYLAALEARWAATCTPSCCKMPSLLPRSSPRREQQSRPGRPRPPGTDALRRR